MIFEAVLLLYTPDNKPGHIEKHRREKPVCAPVLKGKGNIIIQYHPVFGVLSALRGLGLRFSGRGCDPPPDSVFQPVRPVSFQIVKVRP